MLIRLQQKMATFLAFKESLRVEHRLVKVRLRNNPW